MVPLHPNNHRQRPRSTSNTSPITRHFPTQSYTMSIDEIQGREQCDAPRSVVSPRFPSSSADFNLFPKSRRRTEYSSPRPHRKELTHIRSKAFWELRRSIAENGEGFVRRMRDYECVRSRRIDSSNRSRKRVCTSNTPGNPSYMSDSDVSDDDDVQIFVGELSNDNSQSHHSGNWVTRLDGPSPNLWPTQDSVDESGYMMPILPPPLSFTPYRAGQARSAPLSPDSVASPSALSPPPALSSALPPIPLRHLDDCSVFSPSSSLLPPHSFGPTHSTDKTVSDLGLALANGAGSINDYSYPENLPTFQSADGNDPGELWQ